MLWCVLVYPRAVKAEPKPKETVVLVSHGGPTTYALRALSRQKPKGKTFAVDAELQDSSLAARSYTQLVY